MEEKEEQSRAWVSSKCKKGEVCDILCSSTCICRLLRACIREKHPQAAKNADLSSRVGQPGIRRSTGPSSRLSDFWWLVSSMLTYLLALVNPASVGQQVLAAAFLTSDDWSPLCPTLIFWLTFSWVLPPADSPLLLPVSFSLPWFLPSFPRLLPVSWDISRTSSLCGFRAKTNKGILWLPSIYTHNECPTSCQTA